MQGKFGPSLACINKHRHATSNECRERRVTQEVKDPESNNNKPMGNPAAQTVQNGATASDHETENVSETSSAKQRREERMKKFDIEFRNQDATGTRNQASTNGGKA